MNIPRPSREYLRNAVKYAQHAFSIVEAQHQWNQRRTLQQSISGSITDIDESLGPRRIRSINTLLIASKTPYYLSLDTLLSPALNGQQRLPMIANYLVNKRVDLLNRCCKRIATKFNDKITYMNKWHQPDPPSYSRMLEAILMAEVAFGPETKLTATELSIVIPSATLICPVSKYVLETGPMRLTITYPRLPLRDGTPTQLNVRAESLEAQMTKDGCFWHPHVDDHICMGDAHWDQYSALSRGYLIDAFRITADVLGTYNIASPYRKLEHWERDCCDSDDEERDGSYCPNCEEWVDANEELVFCQRDSYEGCNNCLVRCSINEQWYPENEMYWVQSILNYAHTDHVGRCLNCSYRCLNKDLKPHPTTLDHKICSTCQDKLKGKNVAVALPDQPTTTSSPRGNNTATFISAPPVDVEHTIPSTITAEEALRVTEAIAEADEQQEGASL